MSYLGSPYDTANRIPSQRKMNLKGNLVGTGDQILAVSSTNLDLGQEAIVTANSTNGALLQWHIYVWRGVAGGGWIIKSQSSHTHKDANDGGRIEDVFLAAIKNLWYVNMISPTLEQFHRIGSGGTYSNHVNGYVELATGATTNNSANLVKAGGLYTFSQKIKFNTRLKLSNQTTNFTARIGMNAEYSHSVTDNLVKFGFEACTSCNGTDNQIFSNDGVGLRSKHNVTDPCNVVANYMVELDVGANVNYYKDANTVVQKNTVVPSSGIPNRQNAFVTGVQTTTTTSVLQELYLLNIVATIGETNLPG